MRLSRLFISCVASVAIVFAASPVAAADVGHSCAVTDDGVEASFVYDKDFVELLVTLLDAYTPYEAGSGLTLSSVSMTGGDININATVSRAVGLKLKSKGLDEIDSLKHDMAVMIYSLFAQLGPDDNGDSLVQKMQDYGIGVNYNFYVDGEELPVLVMALAAGYINAAGSQDQMVYSV